MASAKNIIITACNARYGDFLIKHWLKSLKENVDLKNIDIAVLDYGLSENHVLDLKKQEVIVAKGSMDAHINLARFKDIANFLSHSKYDQAMTTDGGDLIFQTDVSNLFLEDKSFIRAAPEELNLVGALYIEKNFRESDLEKIKKTVSENRLINAGVIIGPTKELIKLFIECYDLVADKNKFGPDQVALNYLLTNFKFKELDTKFNFIIWTNTGEFYIKNGYFYFPDNTKIPIVHNAGRYRTLRFIKNFGYGTGYNNIKPVSYVARKIILKAYRFFSKRGQYVLL